MKLKVPEEIIDLAEIFEKNHAKLYIVGGYVRSSILGVEYRDDIDLASAMHPEYIIQMLKNTKFNVSYKNKLTGVLAIEFNGEIFEHATFRTECYAVSGEHMPCEVEFINDIFTDASRRDFTASSIYYDISACEFIDPFNGISDIKNKITTIFFFYRKFYKESRKIHFPIIFII